MTEPNHEEALERYDQADTAWADVRNQGLDDTKFSMLGEQWPPEIQNQRAREGRPCLTINHMPKFIRQVVNDARQNTPAVKVRPCDSKADIETAEIYDGIIRHIESSSDADIAYDTAVTSAIIGAMGFFRINIDYATDDAFDLDIRYERILNNMSVLFDPLSQAADSSDWRYAFITDDLPKDDFEKMYPGAESSSFEGDGMAASWFTENTVRVAEYWCREEIEKTIWKMSDGQVVDEDILKRPEIMAEFQAAGIIPGPSRKTKSYKVVNHLMNGAGVLKSTDWPGTVIPIVPVFGEETNVEGRRIFQSLVFHGKDAQRSFNFWRSAGAELIALAPRTPYIMNQGSFPDDPKEIEKWGSANSESHAFLLFKGSIPPQRTDFAGVPAGVLQEANLAAEDMRTIIGISNPGLGVPDPRETSGKALRMRRKESDTETYHFHDNLKRSIRGAGRILVEIIPKVYTGPRVVRILGLDGKNGSVPINQPIMGPGGQPQMRPNGTPLKYDLAAGKYDIVVDTGPSYATQREEAAEMLTSAISAAPEAAPILLPQLVKMMDTPEGEKVTSMLATMMPPAARAIFDGTPPPPPQPPPEVAMEQAKSEAALQRQAQEATFKRQQAAEDSVHKRNLEREQAAADIAVEEMKAATARNLMEREAQLKWSLMEREAELKERLAIQSAAQKAAQQAQQANQPSRGSEA